MRIPALSLCLSLISSMRVFAAPVDIGDPSFELNTGYRDGNQLPAKKSHKNLGPEWQETKGPGNAKGVEEHVTGFAADGTDHLRMAAGHDVWQDLGTTYQANFRYTLTVAIGKRSGSRKPGAQSRYLLADGTGSIHATGMLDTATQAVPTFVDAPPLVFETSASSAAVGRPIRILLQARGKGRFHFDNIRLDAEPLIPPGAATAVMQAATGITATAATLQGLIADPGDAAPAITFFWGPANGGRNPAAWAHSATLPGVQAAGFSLPVSGLAPGTVHHFTARAVNSAGTSWALAPATFTTLPILLPAVANRAAAGITATTASLRGEVTDPGNGTTTVTIFHGTVDGGTNPSNWQFATPAIPATGNFSRFLSGLQPGTSYLFRCRVTNEAGSTWAPETLGFTTPSSTAAAAVIHEIHYRPADRTSLEEFIELHNPGNSAVDVSGWSLRGAVAFTFPAGSVIPAGGYLVAGENPAALLSKHAVTAAGPWTGNLSSAGERIDLHDAAGQLRDRVDYGAGFPWPTAAAGAGGSAALLHPALDNDLGGSWRSSDPTPGSANAAALPSSSQAPPQIRQVAHSPESPAPGESVIVTARITDPDGTGAVALLYQTVDPGAYVRLGDPAYATSWTPLPMTDDGVAPDLVAGDSTFTAALPAALQTNRRLVRYRIQLADAAGNSVTVPYPDDEQPNFAYYVYQGLPDWQGAFRPGSGGLQNFPAAMLDDIPVYSLIANDADVIASQYESGSDGVRFRGTFVCNGKVYDHIEFKNRGEASTYQSGKNKWRFFFNRARQLRAANHFGEEYAETWDSFSAEACASPWVPAHRGMAGVEVATSYKLHDLAGLPSPRTHYYHFRVVRGGVETSAAGTTVSNSIGEADGQYAGDFWGLYLALEDPDGSFLDERGLPDGNLYKIEGNAGDKKHQGRTQPADASDWNAFRDTHVSINPTVAWWRANMDLEAYYTFHAINRLTGNVDLRGGQNHYFYHRSSDNRWVPVPWDLDMMFIPRSHWTTSFVSFTVPGVIHAHRSILGSSALDLEYRNRAREILDLLASDPNPGGGQVGQLIDEFASMVNPVGQPSTWADADAAMWNLHPRTRGTDGVASGQSNHRGNFYRTTFNDTRFGGDWVRWLRSPASSGTMEHEDSMAYLRDYATNTWPGGQWLPNNGDQRGYGYRYLVHETADPAIPLTPVVVSAGGASFAVDDLTFTSSAFSDPQGAGSYARTRWRLAEISGPGVPGHVPGTPRAYEIQPVWTFESTAAPGSITIPLGVAVAGKTYRVRARHQDNSGRWSSWSAPVQFTAAAPPPRPLLHYWSFNAANPARLLTATRTTGGGRLKATPAASAIADSGEGFSGANSRDAEPAGNHLRFNNPLGSTLELALPTTGHEGIVVRYETRRSRQGAGSQLVSYTIDGTTYLPFATDAVSDADPVLRILDFRNVAGVDGNPDFGLRIEFARTDGGTAGNHRFDNLTVEARRAAPAARAAIAGIPSTFDAWRVLHFPDPAERLNDAISGPEAAPAGDGVTNLIRYAHGVGPRDPVAHLLPVLVREGGGYRFRIRYDPSLADLVWNVRAGTDLANWPQSLFDSSSDPAAPAEDGWLGIDLPVAEGSRIFVRLELRRAP